ASEPLERVVGRRIPVPHRERVGHVVSFRAEAAHEPLGLEGAPANDRRSSADLPVVLLDLFRSGDRDHSPDQGLADRTAGKLDDLAILEEPHEKGADRFGTVGPAQIEEEDSGLQTVREKIGFSPSRLLRYASNSMQTFRTKSRPA